MSREKPPREQLPLPHVEALPLPTRDECRDGERPCARVDCPSHLWAEHEPPGRRHDEATLGPNGGRPSTAVVRHSEHSCAQDLVELGIAGRHEDTTGRDKGRMWSRGAIGAVMGIGEERVRQVEHEARDKVRRMLALTEYIDERLEDIRAALEQQGLRIGTTYPHINGRQGTFARDEDEHAMYLVLVVGKVPRIEGSAVIRKGKT